MEGEDRIETFINIPLREAKFVNTVGVHTAELGEKQVLTFTLGEMSLETHNMEYVDAYIIGPETCAALIVALMDQCASNGEYALALTVEMLNKTTEKAQEKGMNL